MTHPKLATARSGYGGRGYYLPGHEVMVPGKDKPQREIYPSVTTVLKAVAKDGLHQWIADQVAAYAVRNIAYLQQVSDDVAWRFLRFYWSREAELVGSELRLYHEGVRDDAAEMGTNLHEWVEAHLDGTVTIPEADSVEAEEMIGAFLDWVQKHAITSNNAEFTLFNSRLGVVGTADADWWIFCTHEGPACIREGLGLSSKDLPVRCLVDLKTSRHTWPEHGMQLACLNDADVLMVEVPEDHGLLHESTVDGKKQRSWWIEQDAPKFDAQILLHIRPTDLTAGGDIIDPFCELIDLTEDIPVYIEGFEGALALTRMKYTLKQRATARKIEQEA